MSRVLVVDDEERYRDHVGRALSRDGHEVRAVAGGREAISIGAHYRPEVLVVDWMLKDRLHGLNVSEALRAVVPDMKTVLISGFPSSDLRNEAQCCQVSQFLEKPFELGDLRNAVRTASLAPPPERPAAPLAVVVVDRNGAIQHANRLARDLLATTSAGADADSLWDVFDVALLQLIPAATEKWITASPKSAGPEVWHIRAAESGSGESWLLIIVPEQQAHLKDHPAAQALLDIRPLGPIRWPFAGRVLMVDDYEAVRRVVAAQIERAGAICHTAGTLDMALRTFHRDPGIDVVILDHDMPFESVRDFVQQIRASRPGVQIVGSSGNDRRAEFASMGVTCFLPKPWTVTTLVNMLLDRIGNCVDCGLALPLRRPRAYESGEEWACTGCGRGYRAVFDDDTPAALSANVRRVGRRGG